MALKMVKMVMILVVITLLAVVVNSFQLNSERYGSYKTSSTSLSMQATPSARNWQSKAVGAIFTVASIFSFDSLPAHADRPLNAPSAAGTRVNSDPESLLRYGLPIKNKEIRDVQGSIETIKINIKTRRINFAVNDANNVINGLTKYSDKIMKDVPDNHKEAASKLYEKMKADVDPLKEALVTELAAGAGSVQERKAADAAFAAQKILSKDLSSFEELMVPDTYKRTIPEEYAGLPVLNKRACVEMIFKKPDGSQYDIDGTLYDEVKIAMVIDGYNAPISGGNFVDLIDKGFYKGMKIQRSDGFVVQTGDANPDGKVHGYVPPGSKEERKIPLELSILGDKELLYSATTEDDQRGYAATVLPFQAYGALGQAREEFEVDSASSQFFWLLFESDLTPAGKNLMDGRYTTFGYTIMNEELLKDVKEGDVIASARVVEGLENLVR